MTDRQIDVVRVSHGVGGSYTRWQGTPPPHAVYMCGSSGRWTTVTVWYDSDAVIHWENGGTGPNATPFAHDMDMDDRPREEQTEIWDRITTELPE